MASQVQTLAWPPNMAVCAGALVLNLRRDRVLFVRQAPRHDLTEQWSIQWGSGVPISDGGVETDHAAFLSLAEMEAFDEPLEPWCEWLVRRVSQGEYRVIPPELDNPYHPRLAFL